MSFIHHTALIVGLFAFAACDRPQVPAKPQEISPQRSGAKPATVQAADGVVGSAAEMPEPISAFAAAARVRKEAKIDDSDPTSKDGVIRGAADPSKIPEYLALKKRFLELVPTELLSFKMPTRREREAEIAEKEQGVATLRRELDRILKIGHITDSDVTSIDGDVRVSPGADSPNGGNAALNEYRDIKLSYLKEVILLNAIRAAHEKENAEESNK